MDPTTESDMDVDEGKGEGEELAKSGGQRRRGMPGELWACRADLYRPNRDVRKEARYAEFNRQHKGPREAPRLLTVNAPCGRLLAGRMRPAPAHFPQDVRNCNTDAQLTCFRRFQIIFRRP